MTTEVVPEASSAPSITHKRRPRFYRELSDLFGLDMARRNRWGGFKSLRAKWNEHLESTHLRRVQRGPSLGMVRRARVQP